MEASPETPSTKLITTRRLWDGTLIEVHLVEDCRVPSGLMCERIIENVRAIAETPSFVVYGCWQKYNFLRPSVCGRDR